jgi:hypothetical protein
MNNIKNELETYCELHWWNGGRKTLSFKGNLKDLLENQKITFTKSKSDVEGLYIFKFKSAYNISFKVRGTIYDFRHYAKQFIQMELVRMGDKSQLYVQGSFRPTVTVNY